MPWLPRFMAVVEWAQNVNLHWAVVDFVDNYMPSDEYVLDAINFVVFFGLMVVDMANDEFVDLLIDYADRLWEDVIPGKSRQDLIESGLDFHAQVIVSKINWLLLSKKKLVDCY